MKKLGVLAIISFMFFGFNARVDALSFNNKDGGGDINSDAYNNIIEVVKGEESTTIKIVTDNATLDFVFYQEDGEIILDLNGHTMTNYCTGCSAINIQNGAKVTIKDSSPEKTGAIKYKENAAAADNGYYASLIRNEGTLTVESGTIEVNKGGDTIDQQPYAIGIDNLGTLNISGGKVITSHTNAWGINNQSNATATISGGTFDQQENFSIIANHGTMNITDGDFTASEESNALITNAGLGGEDAILTISSGNFSGNNNIFYNAEENSTIEISGGEYEVTGEDAELNISQYIKEGFELDENGDVVEKQEPVKKPEPVKEPEKETNPVTGDKLLTYVSLSVISLTGALGTGLYLKKVNE